MTVKSAPAAFARATQQGAASAALPGRGATTAHDETPKEKDPKAALHASRSGAALKPATSRPAHPTPAHHILLLLILVYLLAHVGMLLHQTHQWLVAVRAGHALTPAGLLRMVLVMHEVLTVTCGSYQLRAVRYSSSSTEIADRSLLQFALIVPVFQCLIVVVNTSSWNSDRSYWGLQASMALIGVLCRFKPSHSFIHALSSGTLITCLQCFGSCFLAPSCGLSAWQLARSFIVHGSVIQLAGMVAWAASYTAVRKGAKRREVTRHLSSENVAEHLSVASLQSGLNEWIEGQRGSGALSRKPSGALSRKPSGVPTLSPVVSPEVSANAAQAAKEAAAEPSAEPTSAGLRQRRHARADSDAAEGATARINADARANQQAQQLLPQQSEQQQQSERQQQQSASQSRAAGVDVTAAPVPLEFLGIYVFRALGVAPTLQRLDARVDALIDSVDEAWMVRLVCMPVAIHCLLHAVLARLNFLNYDYGCISYDLLFMWMAAFFMLGRDSVTFDMNKALTHVQAQLAASLRALSKPRQPTVKELVDSVRQQIAGGGECSPEDAHGMHDSVSGEEIKLLEMLGEGTFGKVYKGIWRGTVVAVKSVVLPRSAGLRKERMAIMEAAISSALQHPNVLQTHTYSLQPVRNASDLPSKRSTALPEPLGETSPDQASGAERDTPGVEDSAGVAGLARGFEVRLVTEFMDLGTLRDALDRHVFRHPPDMDLEFTAVLDTALDIAKGIQHLHSLNIIHGDLKARNVLLKTCASDPRGFTAKIADFGLSHKMETHETHVSKLFQGTPTHMAPEVFLHGNQSKGADAYSFGITMWELLTGHHAFQGISPALLAHHVADLRERPRFPLDSPHGYALLAERCWDADVRVRPCFSEIVATLIQMRKGAGGHKPFPSIAERLQAAHATDLKSFGHDLPSAIVLGEIDSRSSTWNQLDKGKAKNEAGQQAPRHNLPSAIVLGPDDSRASTWHQL